MSGILLVNLPAQLGNSGITGRPRPYMKMHGFLAKISGLHLGKSSRISRKDRQESFVQIPAITVNPVHSFTKKKGIDNLTVALDLSVRMNSLPSLLLLVTFLMKT